MPLKIRSPFDGFSLFPSQVETLALPSAFSAFTLYRDLSRPAGQRYFTNVTTGAHEVAQFDGSQIYVSNSGNDTTGDGSSGTPYATLNKAITEASNNDQIMMVPGEYATPTSNVTKSLAFRSTDPTGLVLIGTFNDLSSVSVSETTATATSGTINVPTWSVPAIVTNEAFAGYIRIDGSTVEDVRGAGRVDVSDDARNGSLMCTDWQDRGVMSVHAGTTSSKFSTGNSDDLDTLIDADAIRAWRVIDTQSFVVSGSTTVYIGPGIILASYANQVIKTSGAANLILDRCEVYGGADSGVSMPTGASGYLRMYGTKVAGSEGDNIDYRGTAVGVEINVVSKFPGATSNDNASTGHDDAVILRVGGTYEGGSRTLHDVNQTEAINVSIRVGNAYDQDQDLLRLGNSTQTPEWTVGDLVTFGVGDASIQKVETATLVNADSAAWPY